MFTYFIDIRITHQSCILGYVADVSYSGEAQYPEYKPAPSQYKPVYKPAPAPAYKPAPAPAYKSAPAPAYKPAPTYKPAPAPTPAYKPAPTPAPAPAPTYKPAPEPTYKPAPATEAPKVPYFTFLSFDPYPHTITLQKHSLGVVNSIAKFVANATCIET